MVLIENEENLYCSICTKKWCNASGWKKCELFLLDVAKRTILRIPFKQVQKLQQKTMDCSWSHRWILEIEYAIYDSRNKANFDMCFGQNLHVLWWIILCIVILKGKLLCKNSSNEKPLTSKKICGILALQYITLGYNIKQLIFWPHWHSSVLYVFIYIWVEDTKQTYFWNRFWEY